MSKHFKTINIRYDNIDIFPAVIDYDYSLNMPRNGSLLFDFFSLGRFSSLLQGVDLSKPVYISLKGMLLTRGIYLLDFKKLGKEGFSKLKELLKDVEFSELYIDMSEYVSPEKVQEVFPDKNIVLLDFTGISNG